MPGRGILSTALFIATVVLAMWSASPAHEHRMLADSPSPKVLLYENQTLWTLSPWDGSTIKIDGILLWVSASAYWYIERNLTDSGRNFTTNEMAYIGGEFDDVIVPRIHAAFGFEPRPPEDIDGDARITVLITPALSIFMPRNEYPSTLEPSSNAKEMIYVRFDRNFGRFLGSVAHEFTHLVEWNYDSSEDGWILEGLARVGERITGFGSSLVDAYLANVSVGLLSGVFHAGASYGAWELFLLYLVDHYGGWNVTRALTQNPLHGWSAIEESLEALGYRTSLRILFRDWIVANLINAPTDEGRRYQYSNVTSRALPTFAIASIPGTIGIGIENGGATYVRLPDASAAISVEVRATANASLIAVLVTQRGGDVAVRDFQAALGPTNYAYYSGDEATKTTLVLGYLDLTGEPSKSVVVSALAPEDVARGEALARAGAIALVTFLFATTCIWVRYRKAMSTERRMGTMKR